MSTAAAAILVANFNIPRTGTGTATISENDISKLKRAHSDVTSMKKPPAPKVSPKNRDRKFTHTGIVEPKDIDSTPRSAKKLNIVKETAAAPAQDVMIITNQTVSNIPVGAAVASGSVGLDQVEVIEHPISPTSGQYLCGMVKCSVVVYSNPMCACACVHCVVLSSSFIL